MKNTNAESNHVICTVDSLFYRNIEKCLHENYLLGKPDSCRSGLPLRLEENAVDEYVMGGSEKNGRFRITTHCRQDGRFDLGIMLMQWIE